MTSETHDAETLLPCPFCGGSAVQFDALKGHKVECENRNTNCPVNMRSRYQISSTDAANLWNTRALPVQKHDAETLLPCPFCGHDADLMYYGEESPADPYCESWAIKCCHCGAAPVCDYWTREKAITAWNTRALPVQKNDADTVERVAKEIAFSGRHQHDVSRNAREFWDHTGSYGQSAARVMARAALSAMPPQEVSVQEAARVLADAWSLESVEGCQFRCLVTRAGHDERISGLKFIAALRALSEKPHG